MKKLKKMISPNHLLYYPENIISKLEKLALEGWKLQKINSFTITLEECEPAPIKYSFIFSPHGSSLEEKPVKPQDELIELCKESGWEYVAMYGQLLVFCSYLEEAIPIETDEKLKLEIIHKSMKKEGLPGQITIVLTMFLLLFSQLMTLKPELLFTSIQIYTISLVPIVIINGILNIFQYYHWYTKSKKSAEQGGICIKPINISWFGYITITGMILMTLGLLSSVTDTKVQLIGIPLFTISFCFYYVVIKFLRKKEYQTKTKWKIYISLAFILFIVLITFTSKVAITMLDTHDYDTQYLGYQYHTTECRSIVASYTRYFIEDTNDDMNMRIKVYDSKFKSVNNQILSGVLRLNDWQLEENTAWEIAQKYDDYTIYIKYVNGEVYKNHQILATQNRVFDIDFDNNSTDEFKELVITELLELN